MESEQKKEKKLSWQKNAVLYLHDLIYALAVLMIVFLLLFRVVVVSGSSMYNTLMDGDCLLVISNLFCGDPKQGDIIVASKESFDDGAPIIKRVIATEGQTVDIDFEAGIVYVDGQALDEPYTYTPTTTHGATQFPLVVEEGCLFVMGDNRSISRDSRYMEIGQIDCREVIGKAVFLVMPGTHKGAHERDFSRIGVLT